MRIPNISRKRDELALRALHMRDIEGLTYSRIGEILGVTKNAVIGMLNRIDGSHVFNDGDLSKGNRDGDMGPMWWSR